MIPFSPVRKRQLVAVREKGSDIVRVVLKGAPEYIIEKCTSTFDE